jgi:hypothetical protein
MAGLAGIHLRQDPGDKKELYGMGSWDLWPSLVAALKIELIS